MITRRHFQILVGIYAILTPRLFAQVITFEPSPLGELPNGELAADDMPISDQFLSIGVTFGIDNDLDGQADPKAYPRLEANGPDGADGFFNNSLGVRDTAAPGLENQLGGFFLRDRGIKGTTDSLLITYSSPVNSASGEIWDIDAGSVSGSEQWTVQALNESGQIIASTESPEGILPTTPGSLDGRPWAFQIDAPAGQTIRRIRIVHTGTHIEPGFSFNNFSPATPLASGTELEARIHSAIEFTWNSDPGKLYQVQWSDSLTSDEWNNLGAPLEGTGVEMGVFDSRRTSVRRFYRVIEIE